MKRPVVFISAFLIGIVAVIFYISQQRPTGLETMGHDSSTMQWLTLTVAIVSLLTSLVGLVQKVIELRATSRG